MYTGWISFLILRLSSPSCCLRTELADLWSLNGNIILTGAFLSPHICLDLTSPETFFKLENDLREMKRRKIFSLVFILNCVSKKLLTRIIIFERSDYWDTGYYNVQFQKIFILPLTEGIEISWGMGGSVKPKNLKKCMKPNWNFQRGGGS